MSEKIIFMVYITGLIYWIYLILKFAVRILDRLINGGKETMTINEYQNLAMRTNDGLCNSRVLGKGLTYTTDRNEDSVNPGELINGALGLTGEAGEVADMIKKYIFHRHNLDKEELVKELGDVCWYVALLSYVIGVPLEEILSTNIEKLKKRYPEGFSEENSINRRE